VVDPFAVAVAGALSGAGAVVGAVAGAVDVSRGAVFPEECEKLVNFLLDCM
jgi:hypothetical protein